MQAGIILQERGVMMPVTEEAKMALSKVSLTDVTNHSYGTITMGHAHGRETLRNSLIIPKNTPIPCTHSDTFFTIHDDQQVIHCTITQGEDLDPEFVNVITEGFMKLPAGRPRGCEILITYSYDANGRMSCEFKDVLTGRIQCFNLDSLPTS